MERTEKTGVVGLGKMDRHRRSGFVKGKSPDFEPEVGAEGSMQFPVMRRSFCMRTA